VHPIVGGQELAGLLRTMSKLLTRDEGSSGAAPWRTG